MLKNNILYPPLLRHWREAAALELRPAELQPQQQTRCCSEHLLSPRACCFPSPNFF